MKVLCINRSVWQAEDKKDNYGPSYMEEVTVIEEFEGNYILAEYYRNPHDGVRESYEKDQFIPLSSIDETEMEREYKTEKVCAPV